MSSVSHLAHRHITLNVLLNSFHLNFIQLLFDDIGGSILRVDDIDSEGYVSVDQAIVEEVLSVGKGLIVELLVVADDYLRPLLSGKWGVLFSNQPALDVKQSSIIGPYDLSAIIKLLPDPKVIILIIHTQKLPQLNLLQQSTLPVRHITIQTEL